MELAEMIVLRSSPNRGYLETTANMHFDIEKTKTVIDYEDSTNFNFLECVFFVLQNFFGDCNPGFVFIFPDVLYLKCCCSSI